MDDQQRRDEGMAQRRKVLGDAWIDKFRVERICVGGRLVDPGIAEHLAALGRAVFPAFLVVQCWPPVMVA